MSSGLRRERQLSSPLYRDGHFHNPPAPALTRKRNVISATSEFFFGGKQRRPKGVLPTESPLETWQKPASTGLRVTWLGHSTTLIEIDGYRVLTDPVWSERISPVSFAGPRRFHVAPVDVAQLPPIDAVIVSHDHYDHLDLPTVKALARKSNAPFVTALGVGARLEAVGIDPQRITELDWWESLVVPGTELSLTAAPSHHFSGRSPFDRNRTLWSSWSIASSQRRVYFSGDTGLTPHFEQIRARLGAHDLVMLEIGAFHEAWGDIHLGPENALAAHRMLGGGTLLPVHWGTFDLALHAWDEPAETLMALAGDAHIVTPRLGRAIEPKHIERIDPWWREVQGAPIDGRTSERMYA